MNVFIEGILTRLKAVKIFSKKTHREIKPRVIIDNCEVNIIIRNKLLAKMIDPALDDPKSFGARVNRNKALADMPGGAFHVALTKSHFNMDYGIYDNTCLICIYPQLDKQKWQHLTADNADKYMLDILQAINLLGYWYDLSRPMQKLELL
jgi:hypothetical protein